MAEEARRPENPRRRRKTKWEIIKEAYLPTIILIVTVIFIIIFIAGALSRRNASAPVETINDSTETTADPYEAQVEQLLQESAALAAEYDYDGAVTLISAFSGTLDNYPELKQKLNEYERAAANMVSWTDPSQITTLSFHGLIADPSRAFSNAAYGTAYNRNFVTVGEFQDILESLYEKNYILVRLSDYTSCTEGEDGHITCEAKPLKLPVGKKPLVLVQTNLSYYTYMVDGDGDGLADKDGAGFASRMVVGDDGKVYNELIDSNGITNVGAYDLVPILDQFVEQHPDFSYRGAKAILAPSGYDGIFGYRTNAAVKEQKGEDYYNQQVAQAKDVVNALRNSGYELACYTYANAAYGALGASEIQNDLRLWEAEVTPILGQTNIMVFAQNSAIEEFSGSKFNVLQNAGFRYYLGFTSGSASGLIGSNYILQNRLNVTGSQMAYSNVYAALFDAAAILEDSRGTVPQ